ncbi:MAG: NAD(P)-binding domain-containing protein [Acidobacteriota bacterium]
MAGGPLDLLIVGSGPAGLAAAKRAQHHGMTYRVLEGSDHLADTIHRYQKGKHVMAEPGLIPLHEGVPFAAGSREEVLAALDECAAANGLAVHFGERVTAIERAQDAAGFRVTATSGTHSSKAVVLAIGTRGNPRRLGVPGDDLPQVSHRLVDPDEVVDEDVVVVGAGDSALEVALALADRNRVSVIVRRAEIVRAEESLEREVLSRNQAGGLTVHFSTTVRRIAPGEVELAGPEMDSTVAADRVFLMLGAEPPRRWLESIGVAFSGSGREARPVLDASYQSAVPGLYLIGAVTGRDLIKLAINQGHEVVEHILGHPVEAADEPVLRERLPFWDGTADQRIAALRREVPLLAAAGEADLRELFLAVTAREAPDGEVVVRQNDYTDSFQVIAAGTVEVWVRTEGAAEDRLVATLGAGNFFGEMSLISNRRRNATVISRGARLIEIPRKAMLKLLALSPEVKAMVDRAFLVRAFQGYLFPGVDDDTIWPLASRAEVSTVDKGKTLFEEGDPADSLYLIRSGMVKVSKRSGDREIVLSYLVAGNFFGEVSLLPDALRTAAVSTIFPCELIRLGHAEIASFLAVHPELAGELTGKLEERQLATLRTEATPGAGQVLTDLIREEVVIGTDALIIDHHLCVRCDQCIRACEGVHDDGQARLSLTGIQLYNLLAPNSCWQCENPLCMLDCPPDAIVRNARGEVQIKSNCIGCGNCEANCPYGNIFMVHTRPEPSFGGWLRKIFALDPAPAESDDAGREVAVKCDLCADLPGGPACVRSCPTGAAIRLTPDEYQQTLEELIVRQGEP